VNVSMSQWNYTSSFGWIYSRIYERVKSTHSPALNKLPFEFTGYATASLSTLSLALPSTRLLVPFSALHLPPPLSCSDASTWNTPFSSPYILWSEVFLNPSLLVSACSFIYSLPHEAFAASISFQQSSFSVALSSSISSISVLMQHFVYYSYYFTIFSWGPNYYFW